MNETTKYWTNLGTVATIGIALFVAVLNMHSSLNGQMSDLRGQMADVRGEVSVLRGEVTDIRERLARIETRVDHIENRLARIEGRVDRIENHLGITAVNTDAPATPPVREPAGAIGAMRSPVRNLAAARSPQAAPQLRSESRNSRIVPRLAPLLAWSAENLRFVLMPGPLRYFVGNHQRRNCVA